MAKVEVIAEAAQGYEGDPSLARRLVAAGATAGADVVKFQLVYADELATPEYEHYELFSRLQMSDVDWHGVADEARSRGVGLAFDVFGPRSLDLAMACGARAVKVHSTDFFHHELVESVLQRAPRVYFSVGGIEPEEVADFLERHRFSVDRLTMMYGFQAEPTPLESNHLWRLEGWRSRFPDLALGFMDHTDGGSDEAEWLGLLALPFGVSVLEKHITLDRVLQLENWVSALDPAAFARYVARIRAAERALGNPNLELSTLEREYGQRTVKVIVAARELCGGAMVEIDDVTALRAPVAAGRTVLRRVDAVVGRRTRRRVDPGQPIYAEDLR